ncbi:MAG TPA: sigma 54-interacting transcriptional regulator [Vicinamibacterales bacterium]|nr:sigma 54-interacting transcriptional regulator [Vicinamibacterales bacterium]
MASSLERPAASTQNGGVMVRGWCRSSERRRGIWTILSAVAAALPGCSEARHLRQRFEWELRDLLQAREVELRDGCAMARPPDSTLSIDVTAGDFTLGAIDAEFEPGRAFDEWERELIESARELAALVLIIDRVQRAGTLGVVTSASRADGAAPIVGSSAGIRAVRARIERVAPTGFTILIQGESGVGKELVARQIHDLSPRRGGPFIPVNCAAIVETLLEAELFGIEDRTATGVRGRRGKFEAAHGGTLFLDEVADLSQSAQAKLLRAIQEMSVERVGGAEPRQVDTRIIAATNSGLSDLVARGRFRMDLFYRLNGVEIDVPPLRQRPGDILELADYFLERHRDFRRLRLSQAASDALLAYRWPGNVRELERVIERAVALADSDQLQLDDLPPALLDGYVPALIPSFQRYDSMRAWGSRYARLVLERCQQNKRQACRELGISYHTLQAYLRFTPELGAGSPPAKKTGAGRAGAPQRCAPESRSEGVPW